MSRPGGTDPARPVLSAGAGRAEIAFPRAVWPLEGFTGQHDPLQVRVLVLAGEARLVWAVLDQTSLAPEPLDAVRGRLAAVTGVESDAVVVSVSHTFSAPHLAALADVPGEEYERMALAREAVLDAVEAAAAAAVRDLRAASVRTGCGTCDVNVNRDVGTEAGWGLGFGEDGYSDTSLRVIRLDGAEGPIAILANYPVQPSVMNESKSADGGRRVGADLAGAMAAQVEKAVDCVAFFLIGAAGDQAPALAAVRAVPDDPSAARSDAGEEGFLVAELLGERLGEAVLAAARTAVPDTSAGPWLSAGRLRVPGQEPTLRQFIRPTRSHVFVASGERELPYWILRFGTSAVVGVQVELSAVTGKQLRDASPFAMTLVHTMMNGAAKYLPDASGYDRMTYEALSSGYARGGAEALVAEVSARLADLHVPIPVPAPAGE